MAISDPLQWIIIGAFILGVAGIIVYFMFRVFRTLNRVDKYLDGQEREAKEPATSVQSL